MFHMPWGFGAGFISLGNGMESMVQDAVRILQGLSPGAIVWLPRVDVLEQDDSFVLQAELPGLDREHIEVVYEDGQIIIRGEKGDGQGDPDRRFRRGEGPRGRFERRFLLSDEIDVGRVRANYGEGLLRVLLPKVKPEKPRRIDVN